MRILRLLVIPAAFLLASCDDPVAPDYWMLGTFELVSINGEPVPLQRPYGTISATVTFGADGVYERRTHYHGATVGGIGEHVLTAFWRMQGTTIELGYATGRGSIDRWWRRLTTVEDINRLTIHQTGAADGVYVELYERR